MDRKDHDFIDKNLKNIEIKDFKYIGNMSGTDNIFVYEKTFGENGRMCIVLNGSEDKNVKIEAETSYNSGSKEFNDEITSLNSWQEIFEYLKKNTNDIVKKVEEYYQEHYDEKIRNAKIARIAKKLIVADLSLSSDIANLISTITDFNNKKNDIEKKHKELTHRIYETNENGDINEKEELVNILSKPEAQLLEQFNYFNLKSALAGLKMSIAEKKPLSYNGYGIQIVRSGYQMLAFIISKNGKKVFDSSKTDWAIEDYDNAVKSAQEYIDKYLASGSNDKAIDVLKKLGIDNAYYVKKSYENKGDRYPTTTKVELKNQSGYLNDIVNLMTKNNITDASQIKVVEKNTNAYQEDDYYDSVRYETYEGWRIVLKIGNDTWKWGVK